MNLWRGLFRLWVLASGLWLLWAVVMFEGRVRHPFIGERHYVLTNDIGLLELDWPRMETTPLSGHRRVEFPNSVVLYAQDGVTDQRLKDFSQSFFVNYVHPRDREIRTKRWDEIRDASIFTVLPILVVLILGLALRWVARGFKQ
jgi:hypothetical protein